jgi:signal transduction histidine kinase
VELGALAREVVARQDPATVVDVVDTPVWTDGNADELSRVVANLVDNAVRHTRTRVRVTTAAEGGWAVVAVTDDGPGIPSAERDRVFERFTRLDDSRARSDEGRRTADEDTGGAGLGLAIVRELVRRHGGTVSLTDARAAGTPSAGAVLAGGPDWPGLRVEVRLPLQRQDLEAP